MDRIGERFALWVVEFVPLVIYALFGSLLWVAAVSAHAQQKLGAADLVGMAIRNLMVALAAAVYISQASDIETGKVVLGVMGIGFAGDGILFIGYTMVRSARDDPMGTARAILRKWIGKDEK